MMSFSSARVGLPAMNSFVYALLIELKPLVWDAEMIQTGAFDCGYSSLEYTEMSSASSTLPTVSPEIFKGSISNCRHWLIRARTMVVNKYVSLARAPKVFMASAICTGINFYTVAGYLV
jgi:hypothetical protein